MSYSSWGREELDMTEHLFVYLTNTFQCLCLRQFSRFWGGGEAKIHNNGAYHYWQREITSSNLGKELLFSNEK